jgi:hypothetical protein
MQLASSRVIDGVSTSLLSANGSMALRSTLVGFNGSVSEQQQEA